MKTRWRLWRSRPRSWPWATNEAPQIHDEWKRNLLVNRPDLTRGQLDRHVRAAAIRCNANVIALNLEVKRLAAERAELIASLGD